MRVPHILLLGYIALFAICGWAPHDRATWWAENIPIVLIAAGLVATFGKFRFSNMSYLLMSVLVYMHTIGGHFTFERVPFDWITDMFSFERNHYDRIAHFSVGFYAYPIAELLLRKKVVRSTAVLLLFPVFAIFTVAALYEIIEWIYAALQGGSSGAAFLGSQGDIWDAQRDMLADGLGAIVVTLYFWVRWRRVLPDGDWTTSRNLVE